MWEIVSYGQDISKPYYGIYKLCFYGIMFIYTWYSRKIAALALNKFKCHSAISLKHQYSFHIEKIKQKINNNNLMLLSLIMHDLHIAIERLGHRDRMIVHVLSAYHHWRCEFESRSVDVYSIQHYVIKFVRALRQVVGFLRILRFPPPINWPPRYNWNIVESGVKH